MFWPVQNDFCCDFDFFVFFCSPFVWLFLKCSKNLHKLIKSEVSDTNGRRNRDFRSEIIQNEVGEIDFRCTGTHFMTFFRCLSVVFFFPPCIFFLYTSNRHPLMSHRHMAAAGTAGLKSVLQSRFLRWTEKLPIGRHFDRFGQNFDRIGQVSF